MTYVAVAVEVAVSEKGELSIPRADIAVDCGPRVNPERIRAQMEGAFFMGQCLALLSEITFKNGAVEQGNFDTYQVTRIDVAPTEISLHFVGGEDWSQPPGGVGEPGPTACCACDLQCDLCRNRQAHPLVTPQGSIGSVTPLLWAEIFYPPQSITATCD